MPRLVGQPANQHRDLNSPFAGRQTGRQTADALYADVRLCNRFVCDTLLTILLVRPCVAANVLQEQRLLGACLPNKLVTGG